MYTQMSFLIESKCYVYKVYKEREFEDNAIFSVFPRVKQNFNVSFMSSYSHSYIYNVL